MATLTHFLTNKIEPLSPFPHLSVTAVFYYPSLLYIVDYIFLPSSLYAPTLEPGYIKRGSWFCLQENLTVVHFDGR